MEENSYRYFAFISYNHNDKRIAKWLQRKLERYRLPSALSKKEPSIPRKLKVFRDKTDLQPGFLSEELKKELDASKYLIVICSPHSAQSKWVGEEIEHFKRIGRQNCIIPFIVDGIPYSDNERECYNRALKEGMPELLGVNIHEEGDKLTWMKRERAFIKVVSKMFDITFDSLWQRQRRYLIRKSIIYAIVIIIVGILAFFSIHEVPFDSTIRLSEITTHNANLPFRNGTLTMILNNDTLKKRVDSMDSTLCFRNIPGRFKSKHTRVIFEMEGFEKVDTLLSLDNKIEIPIRRNDSWGVYKGFVVDGDGNPIISATVSIANTSMETDANGYFKIEIPLGSQLMRQTIVVKKTGYQTWSNESAPSNTSQRKIMLFK